jgi:hypothetical protein
VVVGSATGVFAVGDGVSPGGFKAGGSGMVGLDGGGAPGSFVETDVSGIAGSVAGFVVIGHETGARRPSIDAGRVVELKSELPLSARTEFEPEVALTMPTTRATITPIGATKTAQTCHDRRGAAAGAGSGGIRSRRAAGWRAMPGGYQRPSLACHQPLPESPMFRLLASLGELDIATTCEQPIDPVVMVADPE